MQAPDFWYGAGDGGWRAAALAPLGRLYGRITRFKLRNTVPARASVPVICIGNITAGGTGKTPVAIAVAEALRTLGHAPVFLTRGYGGRVKGPIRVEAETALARDVGDEPLLLARHGRTIVAADRARGAEAAANTGASVIVMDDGYQNPSLHKDVGLIVADKGVGLGNGMLIPAGPLREVPGDALARAAAVILMGPGEDDGAAGPFADEARAAGVPVLHAHLEPAEDARRLAGRRVLAFAGIGRPAKFFDTLAGLGAEVAAWWGFPDHHVYTEKEAEALVARARAEQLQLVTTEKDVVRMRGRREKGVEALLAHTITVPVEAVFTGTPPLDRFLEDSLREAARVGAYKPF